MKRLAEIIKLIFGLPISAIAIFFIARTIFPYTQELIQHIAKLNILLLSSGFICFFFYFVARAILWQKILHFKGHTFSFKEIAFLWAYSELKRFIPGNIWSIFTRFLLFSKKKVEKKIILSAIVEEAKVVFLGSAFLSVFCFSFVFYGLLPSFPYPQLYLPIEYAVLSITAYYVLLNPAKHTQLLFASAISFLFFGLGTYLSILSIAPLDPYFLITFISFFTFSYFVGYLSFVTPMGLGIREGIMALGLSRFISQTLAGFSALFARIVLIAAELIFLAFAFAWYQTKNTLVGKTEAFIVKYKYELLLGIAILIYVLYFTNASFLRFDNFYTGRFDLGNMDQTVWNTTQGRIFQLTNPDGTDIISRLAYHADFILILLAPFYFIWSDPHMLLLIQTVVLALGAIFVFFLAKKIIINKSLAFIFSFAYLLNPSIQHANLYDFHAVTLATTFLLGSFYFLLNKKYLWFLLFSILAGLTKENVWTIVALFGGYIAFTNAQKKELPRQIFGVVVCIASLTIFYYLVWHAIPAARGAQHFALSYYSDFGDNPTNIVKNIVFSPGKTIKTLSQTDRITYVVQLLEPLGFLPLLSPVYLFFAAPDLFISLLSNNAQLRQLYFHYGSTIVPFIFIAGMQGSKRAKKWAFFIIGTALLSAYFYGPLPAAKNPNLGMFTAPLENREFIKTFLASLDKQYSIAATNNVGSHVSQREKIYTIPQGLEKADIVIFLLNDQFAQPSLLAQKAMAESLKRNRGYKLLVEQGNFVAFQKLAVAKLLLK